MALHTIDHTKRVRHSIQLSHDHDLSPSHFLALYKIHNTNQFDYFLEYTKCLHHCRPYDLTIIAGYTID